MGEVRNSLKGFDSDEVFVLYKYICWYESNSDIIRDNILYRRCPLFENFWRTMSRTKHVFKTERSDNMPITAVEQESNTMVYTKCVKTKLLSFLRHLRNSIAHGKIESGGIDNNVVTICDYTKDGTKCTCMGNMNKTVLINILKNIQV